MKTSILKAIYSVSLIMVLLQPSSAAERAYPDNHTSISVHPSENKRWHELATYDLKFKGNQIILVLVRYKCLGGDGYCCLTEKPIQDIYDYLTSWNRIGGTYHLHVGFYDGMYDSYGNMIFSDALYATSFQVGEAKKYQSATFFDEGFGISTIIDRICNM